MQITKIQSKIGFHAQNSGESVPNKTKPEFIDKLSAAVKNPRDVNDCVAVPRGIFKAYMFIMGGSALMGISSIIPQKAKWLKNTLFVSGNILNFISAIYFAKPFFVKGLSPTIKREDINKN